MINQTPKQKHAFRRIASSRGKLYLQNQLPWLNGFPIAQTAEAVTFMVLPQHDDKRPFSVEVGREALHNATFASKQWSTRLPRLLTGLVSDPIAWRKGVPELVNILKTAVHQNRPLPKSLHTVQALYPSKTARQFEATLGAYPTLQPLLHALSWTVALSPTQLPTAIGWAVQQRDSLSQILAHQPQPDALVTCLMLWQISQQDGLRRLEPLLRWFGNPLTYTTASFDAEELLTRWISGLQQKKQVGKLHLLEKRPSPVIFSGLRAFLEWLYRVDKNSRRRALALFEQTTLPDLVASWAAWWSEVAEVQARALQLDLERQYAPNGKVDGQKIQAVVDQLVDLRQKRPTYLHLPQLHTAIQMVAEPDSLKLYQAIVGLLPLLPPTYNGLPTRQPLLNLALALDKQFATARLVQLLNSWKQYRLRYPDRQADLYLLRTLFARWHHGGYTPYWTFLSRFLHVDTPLAVLTETFEAWHQCYQGLTTDQLETVDEDLVANLQQTTRSVTQTAVYYNALVEAGLQEEFYERRHFVLAHALSKDVPDFLQLLKAAQKMANRNYIEFGKASDLLQLLATQSWFQLAHDSLLNPDHLALLVQIANLRQALLQMKAAVLLPSHPIPAKMPSWCERFPMRFHPLLAALATLTPEAEARAERILGKQFPNPQLVEQEIEAISAQLAAGTSGQPERLAKRLANLQQRLAKETAVSPQRLDNLEAKLLQLLHLTILQRWYADLVAQVQAKMKQLFALETLPDWFWHSKQLAIIAPMLALPPAFRSLGVRLFRERVNPPPWGLREHPANQAFLTKMAQKKINITAWTTAPPPQIYVAPTGQKVTISRCDDPLDIFHMGSHFRTCLSAGSFNFFSVFANAADVNKQVIYGRNEKGQIVGRCLLALTDDGTILTFEPYSHDPKLEFREMVKSWVVALAEAMNSTIMPSGRVSKLVATDWYDDGSIDIAKQFDFLEEDSDFRDALATMPLAQFVPRLAAKFAPLSLNAFTLPLVIGLRELQQRPDLIVPLMPAVVACKQLPTHVLIRTASLAHAAGEHIFARQIMQTMSLSPILEAYRLYEWLDHPTMLGLAALAPSTTLKVLRRTRPSRVRQDVSETHPHRVEQYAVAYESLGRPNRAKAMRERLAEIRKYRVG